MQVDHLHNKSRCDIIKLPNDLSEKSILVVLRRILRTLLRYVTCGFDLSADVISKSQKKLWDSNL